MNSGASLYIWTASGWPTWCYNLGVLAGAVAQANRTLGLLRSKMVDLDSATRNAVRLAAFADEVINTSEIEGEHLNVASVRSSIARRLGVDIGALAPVDRHVEGIVEMVLDATGAHDAPLTAERLFAWHAALFPTGYSGLSKITTGAWRDDAHGPMQVVSGRLDRQRVHYEAPPAARLPEEMAAFLAWVNSAATAEPPLIRAGLGHLWFVTLHPFDDGNGRIARAVGDLLLARADGSPQRFYSVSAQIQRERKAYYDILEATQKGSMDVTAWLSWFLETLYAAVASAHGTVDAVLRKARFWQRLPGARLNERQVKVLNRLLDGFEGRLTSGKWAKLAKCSPDTALRDISELVQLGVLRRSQAGGRSTSYELADAPAGPNPA
ncbi:cell filamentation protein Fic [Bordetella genomosp. 9]|uniref:Cell filamentation protein Fic n=1 Tax=Bordetella genomosp. 9 TaxID=1416803 RepID=A0A261RMB9_9BORD|nr:Fic family protein [Bordetella genomosp. 9]OZI26169.1 cell filamentation protein Fic [Bordetella genomosp. 9]